MDLIEASSSWLIVYSDEIKKKKQFHTICMYTSIYIYLYTETCFGYNKCVKLQQTDYPDEFPEETIYNTY